MNDSKISVRYSRALFQSALKKKLLDKVDADMIFIAELCNIQQVKDLIHSPIVIPSKKKEIFNKILGNNIENVSLSLINLVVKNGRESFIPSIAREFRKNILKYKGITETILTTAVPVNEKIRKQISDLVSKVFKTKVELIENIDNEIIGGFVLQIEDNYIDASVRNKLRKIKTELSVREIKV